ncbi:MAG: zf-HC2 domain-containing protein, partial [Armatimonadetes bacterium]|nr:zf-HC2 domain-containing protein [Armatimonadota bacterium]
MNCAEVRAMFTGYLDRSLPTERRGGVDEHLSGCEKCSEDVKALRKLLADLHTFQPLTPPEDLRRRVRAQLLQRRAARTQAVNHTRVFSVLSAWQANARAALSYTGLGLASATLVFILLLAPNAIRRFPRDHNANSLHPSIKSDSPPPLSGPRVIAQGPVSPSVTAEPEANLKVGQGSTEGSASTSGGRQPEGVRKSVHAQPGVTSPTGQKLLVLVPEVNAGKREIRDAGSGKAGGGAAGPPSGSTDSVSPQETTISSAIAGVKSAGTQDSSAQEAQGQLMARVETPPEQKGGGEGPGSNSSGTAAVAGGASSIGGGDPQGGAARGQDQTSIARQDKVQSMRSSAKGGVGGMVNASSFDLTTFQIEVPSEVRVGRSVEVRIAMTPTQNLQKAVVEVELPKEVALVVGNVHR